LNVRFGIGYDIHRFSDDPARELRLGGVSFPDDPGLDGHSDADVVLHAIADAILGAVGLGDIGDHFPPGDPTWKDADSADLLRRVLEMLSQRWRVGNIDVSVVCERPRLSQRKAEMAARIAEILDLGEGRVNVKATTNEQLGALGRSEGIAAIAVALIVEV
jgi:2-C-methyl-D-erythritol 2,4-cyclodiphosphate synthase